MMNGKSYALIILSLLPWLYLGADILFNFASRMMGFGYLPFFALLFLKSRAIHPHDKQTEYTFISHPYLRTILLVAVAILLTALAVFLSAWVGNITDRFGKAWLGVLFLAFVVWDIRRDYNRIQQADV